MIQETKDGVQLVVKVTPNSKSNTIIGWTEHGLALRVSATPDKGAANRAVVMLLSQKLGIAQKNIVLLRGSTSRIKHFLIIGLTKGQLISLVQS